MAYSKRRARVLAAAAVRAGLVVEGPESPTSPSLPSMRELRARADELGVPSKGRPRNRKDLAELIAQHEQGA